MISTQDFETKDAYAHHEKEDRLSESNYFVNVINL
jgi:hypothetical protein